jgi:mutator protein MutT/HAD superfamily hydrolase (TIGR01509 family)
MIEVSAGVVFDREGRILICQRGEGRNNAHLWEFPGGKLEQDESPEDCLVRELQEELSLPVTVRGIRCQQEAQGILFHFIDADTAALPVPTEHEDVRFVTLRELLHFDFCPADTLVARQLAFSGIRHVFWDFDGTLLDSYPAMVRSFVAAAADFGIAVTPERALSLMKENLRYCCEIIGGENHVAADELIAAFRRHEQDELKLGLPPIDGIPETLKALHDAGVKHYVATHRDLKCRELLEMAGLAQYFSGYVTQEDKLPRKPAPDMLLHLMRKHSLDPAECLMVGDRPLDTEAGVNAGVLSMLLDMEDRFPGGKCDLRIPAARLLSTLII